MTAYPNLSATTLGCGQCRLVAGLTQAPGGLIYESPYWLVAHARPVLRGATMVYARRHVEQLADLSAEEMAAAAELLPVVLRAMREALATERIYLFYFGEWSPPHAHFTLTPRYSWMPAGNGIANMVAVWADNTYTVDDQEAAAAAEEIRQAMRKSRTARA